MLSEDIIQLPIPHVHVHGSDHHAHPKDDANPEKQCIFNQIALGQPKVKRRVELDKTRDKLPRA
jgi:hypothetical protein